MIYLGLVSSLGSLEIYPFLVGVIKGLILFSSVIAVGDTIVRDNLVVVCA